MSNYGRANRLIGQPTAAVVTTSAADVGTWTCLGPITVVRVGALVTTAPTVTAPVLSFDLRVTYGSDTGRVAAKVGRAVFPALATTGIGKTVTSEVRTPVNAGQQIVCAVTTTSTAGGVIPFIEWVTRTENSANQNSAQLSSLSEIVPLPKGLSLLDGGADEGGLLLGDDAEEEEREEAGAHAKR